MLKILLFNPATPLRALRGSSLTTCNVINSSPCLEGCHELACSICLKISPCVPCVPLLCIVERIFDLGVRFGEREDFPIFPSLVPCHMADGDILCIPLIIGKPEYMFFLIRISLFCLSLNFLNFFRN